jgi:hypothetical protein
MAKAAGKKPEGDQQATQSANQTAKQAALERALVQIEKQYGRGAIMRRAAGSTCRTT